MINPVLVQLIIFCPNWDWGITLTLLYPPIPDLDTKKEFAKKLNWSFDMTGTVIFIQSFFRMLNKAFRFIYSHPLTSSVAHDNPSSLTLHTSNT